MLFGGSKIGGFMWSSIAASAVTLAVVGTIMAVVYIVLLRLIRSEELDDFLGPLARRIPVLRR